MEQKIEFSPDAIERMKAWPMVTEEQERAWILKNKIIPRLAAGGYDSRFAVEIRDWNKEPRQGKLLAYLMTLLTGNGAVIALVGPRGTGKTTLTAQIAVSLAWAWEKFHGSIAKLESRERPPILGLAEYRKLVSITEILKPLYSDHGTIAAEKLIGERERLCGCGLLVIDEKHEVNDLSVANRILTDLIDRRYARRRDTIIISNESADEFRRSTNDSVISRITEHGETLECKWPSMRARKNK